MTSVETIVARVLQREGGVADVGDGKGITRWGQTPDWLTEFSLPTPTSAVQAGVNYMRWMTMTKLDAVIDAGCADDLADIIIDIAVMSDHRKAIKALQQVLNVKVDGVMGPATTAALDLCDRGKTARLVIAWDMVYQGRVITQNPQRAQYAAGWAERMSLHVVNLR